MICRYQAPFSKPLGCRHCFLSLRPHPFVVSSLSLVEQNLQFHPVATLTLWENNHLFLCWGISAKSQILKTFSLRRLPAAQDLEVSAEQVPVVSRSVNAMYNYLHHPMENTASHNTGNPVYTQRYYTQPSHRALRICRIDWVDHCIFYGKACKASVQVYTTKKIISDKWDIPRYTTRERWITSK